jgi:hypothetical protein
VVWGPRPRKVPKRRLSQKEIKMVTNHLFMKERERGRKSRKRKSHRLSRRCKMHVRVRVPRINSPRTWHHIEQNEFFSVLMKLLRLHKRTLSITFEEGRYAESNLGSEDPTNPTTNYDCLPMTHANSKERCSHYRDMLEKGRTQGSFRPPTGRQQTTRRSRGQMAIPDFTRMAHQSKNWRPLN